MGVAIEYDGHDLGVFGFLIGQVLDALAGAYRLGDPVLIRVDAVGRDLLGGSIGLW